MLHFVSFHKRATNYEALLWKMTYNKIRHPIHFRYPVTCDMFAWDLSQSTHAIFRDMSQKSLIISGSFENTTCTKIRHLLHYCHPVTCGMSCARMWLDSTHEHPLTATCCNTLQHAATIHSTPFYKYLHLLSYGREASELSTHCNTLQHTATRCNTLQHSATLHTALQHTVAHCFSTHCLFAGKYASAKASRSCV